MAQVADFEENDLTDFDSTTDTQSILSATTAAVKNGTYGMSVAPDGGVSTADGYGILSGPTDENYLSAEAHFDPNGLTMASGNDFYLMILAGNIVGGTSWSAIVNLRYDGTDYTLRLRNTTDGGLASFQTAFVITDAYHHIHLIWKAATSGGADNGFVHLSVDGVLKTSITGIDNDQRDVDNAFFGVVSGLDSGTAGTFYMDDCKWDALAVTSQLYTWTAHFRASDREDPMHASSDEKRGRA